jgi:hypothetical protein
MVIEWLKIQLAPGLREKYIQKDEEIWTALLVQYPGFWAKRCGLIPRNPMKLFW